MATNTTSNGGSEARTFPAALPVEIPYRSRLSWELGTRVVGGTETELLSRWRSEDGWALAVFRATSETLIIRFQTPAGRELFYGTEASVRSTVRTRLEARPAWRRADRRDEPADQNDT
ncbi:hypothetical protein [Natronomonas sp. LN261]|jgi:hypothetical protein|uniref:hypothetical protein n=1 Tax=Natronomonas sp. LN261 TaxID=2750669 RepID=UPI0015EE5B87|nr:hypothetical protein [Natronomonas sp. LN261]